VTDAIADDRLQRIDALFSGWAKGRQPGACLAVVSGGEVVLKKCYGLADLEHQVPLSSSSTFYILSITKQICATAVLMLEAEGRLGLDDEVQAHLPELPRYEHRLTLHHLLTNTSGVRDELTLLLYAGIGFEQAVTRDQMLDLVYRQRSLDFPPGTRCRYSNSNFLLASKVVERVSGESFRDFLARRIFTPLGMGSTRLCSDNSELAPGLARPYSRYGGESWHKNVVLVGVSGEGGILSSLDDMLLWLGNHRRNRLVPADLIARLSTRPRMANGTLGSYALGLRVSEYRGRRIFTHGGGWPGYTHELCWLPDDDLGILLFTNRDDTRSIQLTRSIAAAWLGLEPPMPKAGAIAPERLAGRYFDRGEGYTMVLSAVDGRLLADVIDFKGGLEQVSTDRFESVYGQHAMSLRLLGTTVNGAPKIEAVLDGGHTLVFERPGPVALTRAELAAHAGTYATPELPVAYRIELSDGGLSLRLDRSFPDPGRQKLTPLGGDLFSVALPFYHQPAVGTFRFLRGAGRAIEGLRINIGRVTNLRMARQPG
jgi:CubicO group peptidase (beta-lactamase class C family)